MIKQLAFFLFLKLFGWISFRDLFPKEMPSLPIVCSFFLGTTSFSILFLIIALVSSLFGQGITWAFWTTMIILLAATLVRYKNTSAFSLLEECFFILSLIALGAVVIITSKYNLTQGTYDSFTYLQMGEILGNHGFFAVPSSLYSTRAIYYPMFHSLSLVFDIECLWSFTAVYAIEFIGAFAFLTFIAARQLQVTKGVAIVLAMLGTALFFTSFLVIYHFFYINQHMTTAAHFTMFFILTWHGIQKQDNRLIMIGLLVLVPSIMMRIENPVYLLIFATLLFRKEFLTRRTVMTISLIVGSAVMFYGLLLSVWSRNHVAGDRMIVIALFGLGMMLLSPMFRWRFFYASFARFTKYWDYVVISTFTAVTVFLFFRHFDRVGHSIIVTFANMVHYGGWEGMWFGIYCLMLVVLTWRMKPVVGEAFLLSSITTFLLSLFVFLAFRTSYLLSVFDSANRMLIHIVPTIIFYLVVKFAANSTKDIPTSTLGVKSNVTHY